MNNLWLCFNIKTKNTPSEEKCFFSTTKITENFLLNIEFQFHSSSSITRSHFSKHMCRNFEILFCVLFFYYSSSSSCLTDERVHSRVRVIIVFWFRNIFINYTWMGANGSFFFLHSRAIECKQNVIQRKFCNARRKSINESVSWKRIFRVVSMAKQRHFFFSRCVCVYVDKERMYRTGDFLFLNGYYCTAWIIEFDGTTTHYEQFVSYFMKKKIIFFYSNVTRKLGVHQWILRAV